MVSVTEIKSFNLTSGSWADEVPSYSVKSLGYRVEKRASTGVGGMGMKAGRVTTASDMHLFNYLKLEVSLEIIFQKKKIKHFLLFSPSHEYLLIFSY